VVSDVIANCVVGQTVLRQMRLRLNDALEKLRGEIYFGVDRTTPEGKLLVAYYDQLQELTAALSRLPKLNNEQLLDALHKANSIDPDKIDYSPGKIIVGSTEALLGVPS